MITISIHDTHNDLLVHRSLSLVPGEFAMTILGLVYKELVKLHPEPRYWQASVFESVLQRISKYLQEEDRIFAAVASVMLEFSRSDIEGYYAIENNAAKMPELAAFENWPRYTDLDANATMHSVLFENNPYPEDHQEETRYMLRLQTCPAGRDVEMHLAHPTKRFQETVHQQLINADSTESPHDNSNFVRVPLLYLYNYLDATTMDVQQWNLHRHMRMQNRLKVLVGSDSSWGSNEYVRLIFKRA